MSQSLHAKIDSLHDKFDSKFDAIDSKFDHKFDNIDKKYATKSELGLFRWLIMFIGGLSVSAFTLAATKPNILEKMTAYLIDMVA